MSMPGAIKFGVSLFSYSSEYFLGTLSLDDTLLKAKEAGAQGVEIVASQMVPGFPYPDPNWLRGFRDRCGELDLDPFCYSAHLDSGLRSDRWLNDDEKVESTLNDIRAAYGMGASVVRTQYTISPALLRRIEPLARRFKVKVGVEIHPPHRLETGLWQDFIRTFRDMGSEYVGIVLDTGIYQEFPHAGWLGVYAQHGVRRETIRTLLDMLRRGEDAEAARAYVEQSDPDPFALEMASEMFSLYRPYREDALRDVLPLVTHFHTKFYHMEDGEERTIPYPALLKVIQDGGWGGYLVSEYEGHYVYDAKEYPAADQVRAHVGMQRRILGI